MSCCKSRGIEFKAESGTDERVVVVPCDDDVGCVAVTDFASRVPGIVADLILAVVCWPVVDGTVSREKDGSVRAVETPGVVTDLDASGYTVLEVADVAV